MERRLAITSLVLVIFALAACSSSGGAATASPSTATSSPSPAATASAVPSETETPTASEDAGGDYVVKTASGSVGTYLTGEGDMTLYTFKNDTKDAGMSTCSGGCATAWPPFVTEGDEKATAGDGVTGSLGTITRDDGTTQVTYNGMPLYYFANDKASGDTAGQGLNDLWFVAQP